MSSQSISLRVGIGRDQLRMPQNSDQFVPKNPLLFLTSKQLGSHISATKCLQNLPLGGDLRLASYRGVSHTGHVAASILMKWICQSTWTWIPVDDCLTPMATAHRITYHPSSGTYQLWRLTNCKLGCASKYVRTLGARERINGNSKKMSIFGGGKGN